MGYGQAPGQGNWAGNRTRNGLGNTSRTDRAGPDRPGAGPDRRKATAGLGRKEGGSQKARQDSRSGRARPGRHAKKACSPSAAEAPKVDARVGLVPAKGLAGRSPGAGRHGQGRAKAQGSACKELCDRPGPRLAQGPRFGRKVRGPGLTARDSASRTDPG